MRRIISLLFAITLLFVLTACAVENTDDRADSSQTDVPGTGTAMRWDSSSLQLLPLGYGGHVEAMAVNHGKLYAVGEKEGSLALAYVEYQAEEGNVSFEEPCALALPEGT